MEDREALLRELNRECTKPVPPPQPVTAQQRRKWESWKRLEEFQQRWGFQ